MIKLVLFDVDGVLINSGKDICETVNYVLNQLNLPTKTVEEIAPTYSAGTYGRFALWIDDETILQKAVKLYRKYYIDEVCEKTELYPHVKETVMLLSKKYKLGVVSNKLSTIIKKILANNEILDCFGVIIGSEMLPAPKPDPIGILKALEIMNANPDNTLMVGDSDVDVLAGKTAGTKTCGVSYGIADLKELKNTNPDFLIDDFSQILDVINNYK